MTNWITDDAGNARQTDDPQEWLDAFAIDRRRVGLDHVGDVTISTVFLGVDHALDGGPPVLWETMVFGGEHRDYQLRYTSLGEAMRGHAITVEMVRRSLPRRVDLRLKIAFVCFAIAVAIICAAVWWV